MANHNRDIPESDAPQPLSHGSSDGFDGSSGNTLTGKTGDIPFQPFQGGNSEHEPQRDIHNLDDDRHLNQGSNMGLGNGAGEKGVASPSGLSNHSNHLQAGSAGNRHGLGGRPIPQGGNGGINGNGTAGSFGNGAGSGADKGNNFGGRNGDGLPKANYNGVGGDHGKMGNNSSNGGNNNGGNPAGSSNHDSFGGQPKPLGDPASQGNGTPNSTGSGLLNGSAGGRPESEGDSNGSSTQAKPADSANAAEGSPKSNAASVGQKFGQGQGQGPSAKAGSSLGDQLKSFNPFKKLGKATSGSSKSSKSETGSKIAKKVTDSIKKKVNHVTMLVGTVLGGIVILTLIISGGSFISNQASLSDCDTTSSGTTTTGTNSSGGTATGDWTQSGSATYNTAKVIFDTLTQKHGFSGAGAAGAIGNAVRESGLDPAAINTGGGVAGLFQWSGFGSGINGSRITAGGFIKAGDKSTLTTDNEVKLMEYEITKKSVRNMDKVAQATDPIDGSHQWYRWYEQMDDGFGSDSQYNAGKTDPAAQKAYDMFGGSNIQYNSALFGSSATADAGSSDSSSSTASDSSCDSSTDTDNSGDVVSAAKSLLGYFTYSQLNRQDVANSSPDDIKALSDVKKDGQTDCSGFVWVVLKLAGYNVPSNVGWYTKSMEDDAKGKHEYLQEISASEAGPGDVVIVNQGSGSGNNGHTAILEETWGSDSTTSHAKIIQEGGAGGDGGVNEGNFDTSFGALETGNFTVTFAKPVKK